MKAAFTTLLLALPCLILIVPPAHAADELGLSWDGRAWSGDLRGSLFDPTLRWVPGDTRTRAFHVRNQADARGALSMSVTIRDPGHLLDRDDIALDARIGAGEWTRLRRTGDSFALATDALPARASVKVTVRARFDPASGNRSQGRHFRLAFHVTLADARAEPDAGGAGDAPLPNAGAAMSGWLVVLGAVAVGGGAALMRRRPRREDPDGTAP